jgi:hypothetical protein
MTLTAADRIRALPRSLHPLPGESLGGFLLRLSYRLHLSPIQLTRRGGILGPATSVISRRVLLDLNVAGFAGFARLCEPEAAALTLVPWAERYPPIARSLRTADQRPAVDDWLFNPTLRYCPRCLAGDERAAEDEPAGRWKLIWQLPIAFACPEHGVELQHRCPQPHPTSQHGILLINRGGESALHPAQCRRAQPGKERPGRGSPACDQRLDQHPVSEPQIAPQALALQQRILAMFELEYPAADASAYFTDLRIAVAMLHSSWPAFKDLIDPAAQSQTEQHIRSLGTAARSALDRPPHHPTATAGLLTAAATVLDDPELQAALVENLRRSWDGRPSVAPWIRVYSRHNQHCSHRLRHALEPATRSFRRVGSSHSAKAPARTGGYRPEHIPAFLEQAWFDEHLAPLECGSVTSAARRFAAATLVQWAAGGSVGDAAHYLGFNPKGRQYAPTNDLARWLANLGPDRFTRALHNLAHQLDTAKNPPDYQRRRSALQHWSLTPEEWNEIISQLPPVPGPIRPVLGDRKRQEASVFIWTLVTRGEPRAAPRPIEEAQPDTMRRDWQLRRGATDFQLSRPDPLRHYAALRHHLRDRADRLMAAIDHAEAVR